MKVRQDSRWPDAHERLKALYEKRAPDGMTQEAFGRQFEIGTQGMVWQYLNGYTPLNYDAAAKFASGLRCTINDISPEMADSLRSAIFPFLGKTMRRAAIYAVLAVLPALSHSPESHAFSRSIGPATVYYVNRRFACVTAVLVRFLTRFVTFGGLLKTDVG
jgi:hypothetical protein